MPTSPVVAVLVLQSPNPRNPKTLVIHCPPNPGRRSLSLPPVPRKVGLGLPIPTASLPSLRSNRRPCLGPVTFGTFWPLPDPRHALALALVTSVSAPSSSSYLHVLLPEHPDLCARAADTHRSCLSASLALAHQRLTFHVHDPFLTRRLPSTSTHIHVDPPRPFLFPFSPYPSCTPLCSLRLLLVIRWESTYVSIHIDPVPFQHSCTCR